MEVVRMLGHTGVILKINLDEHKILMNETWFSFDPKLTVSTSMIGQSVQYSLSGKKKINHLELTMQKCKELKGKIQSLNLSIPRISLHTGGQLIHFYITPKHFNVIKYQYKPGDFLQFTYNPMEFKIGKSSYFAITAIKNENRKKAENPQVIKHELRQTINTLLDSNYYAFLDLEFSMSGPEYRGMKFHPEIIQFGLIIADAEGNLVEKFSAYVKPTLYPHVSGKTQEFLKITESAIAYGMSYQDFYDYIKEVIARYNPIFLVWGVSDGFILENSYLLNQVEPLFEPDQLIDLQRVHRQYYQIGQDIGLYNAIKSYEIFTGTQIHDAIVDALVLHNIFYKFKSIILSNEKYPFKENYQNIMNNR